MNLEKKYKIVLYKMKIGHTYQINKFKQIKDELINN